MTYSREEQIIIMSEPVPEVIDLNTRGSALVEIFVNGELSKDLWVRVDTEKGIGTRYKLDENGRSKESEDEFSLATEEVEAEFTLEWKNRV